MAVGGMPDHAHLLARVGGAVSAAKLANMVKGGSSRMLNDTLSDALPQYFDWQEGYGAFSVSRSHVKRVCLYIKDQERHHANNTTWPEWEETSELDRPFSSVRPLGRRPPRPDVYFRVQRG